MTLPEKRTALTWIQKTGIAFLGLGLVFFMIVLLLILVGGYSMPQNEEAQYILIVILSISLGAGVGFLGGNAQIEGTIPFQLPTLINNPIKFGLTGGSAVAIIVFLMGMYFFKAPVSSSPNNESTEFVLINGIEWQKINMTNKVGGSIFNKKSNKEFYGRYYTFAEAHEACTSIELRLPTKKEYEQLRDFCNTDLRQAFENMRDGGDCRVTFPIAGTMSNINSGDLPNLEAIGYYWTSSMKSSDPVKRWVFRMAPNAADNPNNPTATFDAQDSEKRYSCRCVRNKKN